MAGLPDYLMMALGLGGGYIAVKYGGQILGNLKQQTAQAQSQPQQTQQTQQPQLQETDETGQPISTHPLLPRHQNDTRTYTPPHPSHQHPPVPSQASRDAAPIVHKRPRPNPQAGLVKETAETNPYYPAHSHTIKSPSSPPGYIPEKNALDPSLYPGPPLGQQQLNPADINYDIPKGGYGDYGDTAFAYIGYADSYNIPVAGPQWYKSIPYTEVVASQGIVHPQGRVRRAIAANNHNFMPAGFTLSESSVRRGFNNVYSAGT